MDEESFGFQEAKKLLLALLPSERNNLLDKIRLKDPKLAELLKKHLYRFEDLVYLSPKMLIELLREVSLEQMGTALKGGSEKLQNFIKDNISKNMQEELNEYLAGRLVPVSKVEDCIGEIMKIVTRKIEKGELVLDRGSSETIIE